MEDEVISYLKDKKLLKNWFFWLLIISALAIIIRSIPAWIHGAWGCDFGIYFGITKDIAEQKILFPAYTGWGGSYNEFPILYLVNVFAHWITGLEIIYLMPKLTPIFGGLSVFIFYFLANEITKNKKISLTSTLFFAFLPFHVYQTSHASPLTMGHFFIMLSLLFFIKSRKNTRYFFPLIISTILLVMSHHLSTYFYLISIIGIIFIENASRKSNTKTLKIDVFYVFLTSTIVFSYWALVARTVYDMFMSGFNFAGLNLSSFAIILIFYALIFLLFSYGLKFVRKINREIIENKEKEKNGISKFLIRFLWALYPFVKKGMPTRKSRIKKFIFILSLVLLSMLIFLIVEMPWVGFSFTFLSIIYSIPLVFTIAFAAIGFRYTWYLKNGLFLRGWLISLAVSFIIMIITNNTRIFPHRHIEYTMAPIAILTVLGIGGIFSDPFYKKIFSDFNFKKKVTDKYVSFSRKISRYEKIFPIFVILILVSSLSLTTYEVHKALDQSWEEITDQDINLIKWLGNNIDMNGSLITSDHRLERMAEAEGFNTSEDDVIKLWSAENISEYINELIGIGKNYSRITHVIIDDIMKNNKVHIGPDKGKFRSIYMTNETWTEAYDKFNNSKIPIFRLVARNESVEYDKEKDEPVHWTEVYEVNWTYIENIYLISLN